MAAARANKALMVVPLNEGAAMELPARHGGFAGIMAVLLATGGAMTAMTAVTPFQETFPYVFFPMGTFQKWCHRCHANVLHPPVNEKNGFHGGVLVTGMTAMTSLPQTFLCSYSLMGTFQKWCHSRHWCHAYVFRPP